MPRFTKPRGTLDIYDNEAILLKKVIDVASKVALRYNYIPLYIPTFESTALYARGAGETSDIVTKEMYTFKDKGDREITLRPEGTAGVIRAVIENKLYATGDLPLKYYYSGSFFRYERPQVGRTREFMQFGIEAIGTNSYLDDVEAILLFVDIIKELGVSDYVVRVNTFGNEQGRNKHRDNIKSFFASHIDNLCEDCKERFNKNPLRILDCKVDKEYISKLQVPVSLDCLDEDSKDIFDKTLKILSDNNVKYEVDKYLVRGLDYYTGIIFEVDVTLDDGKVLTIGGGGRYSSLVKELDGPDMSCVGFGLGTTRLALYLENKDGIANYKNNLDYYVMPFSDASYDVAYKIATKLRNQGYTVVVENSKKSIGSMFKYASKKEFKYAIMIGDDELKENKVKIKNLETQEQYYKDIESL